MILGKLQTIEKLINSELSSKIKNSFITAINDNPIHNIDDVKNMIQVIRKMKHKDLKVNLMTIEKQAMHPQH